MIALEIMRYDDLMIYIVNVNNSEKREEAEREAHLTIS
jgi:hypothetical protein